MRRGVNYLTVDQFVAICRRAGVRNISRATVYRRLKSKAEGFPQRVLLCPGPAFRLRFRRRDVLAFIKRHGGEVVYGRHIDNYVRACEDWWKRPSQLLMETLNEESK